MLKVIQIATKNECQISNLICEEYFLHKTCFPSCGFDRVFFPAPIERGKASEKKESVQRSCRQCPRAGRKTLKNEQQNQ